MTVKIDEKSMKILSQKGLKIMPGKMLQKNAEKCAKGLQNGPPNPPQIPQRLTKKGEKGNIIRKWLPGWPKGLKISQN